jgi:hypothetical protein
MADVANNAAFRLPNLPYGNDDVRQKQQDVDPTTGTGPTGQVDKKWQLPKWDLQDGKGLHDVGSDTPPGAPTLAPPQKTFTPDEMAMMVSELMAKLDDAQSQVEQNGLQTDNDQRQAAFKKANDAIATAEKKLAEAKHKQKILGPLATIGKVFAGIAAIALTVATGGLAAPLAIALIAYTVVDTALTVANAISQARGGPALDTGSLLQKGFTELAKKCGASDSTAQKIGEGFSIGIQAAIAVATIVASIASVVSLARGAAQMGGLVSKLGATAVKVTKITGISAQLIGGATSITSGGLGISVAINTQQSENAKADKAQFDAIAARLQEEIRNILDKLQLIAGDLNSNMQSAAQVVANVGQTNIAIAGGNVSMV